MKTITIDGVEYNLLPKVKFKAGDWVVIDNCHNSIYQVDSVREYDYMLRHTHGGLMPFPFSSAERLRPWTIKDAKAGDVLANDHHILILKELVYDWSSNGTPYSVKAYCGIKPNGNFEIGKDNWSFCGTLHIHPATKEQRDLLFKKMKEAGYTWDADKKELHKIKHYDISSFYAGMPVLVRADNVCRWDYSVFSRITGNEDWPFAVCNGVNFSQCIPFEGNEHLLGTTDMCDEQYINW